MSKGILRVIKDFFKREKQEVQDFGTKRSQIAGADNMKTSADDVKKSQVRPQITTLRKAMNQLAEREAENNKLSETTVDENIVEKLPPGLVSRNNSNNSNNRDTKSNIETHCNFASVSNYSDFKRKISDRTMHRATSSLLPESPSMLWESPAIMVACEGLPQGLSFGEVWDLGQRSPAGSLDAEICYSSSSSHSTSYDDNSSLAITNFFSN